MLMYDTKSLYETNWADCIQEWVNKILEKQGE